MAKTTKAQGKAFAGVINSLEGLSVDEGREILSAIMSGLDRYALERKINPSEVCKN